MNHENQSETQSETQSESSIPNCEVIGCYNDYIGYFCECHVPLCEEHLISMFNNECIVCGCDKETCDVCFNINGHSCECRNKLNKINTL